MKMDKGPNFNWKDIVNVELMWIVKIAELYP